MCSIFIDSDGVRKNYIHRKKRPLGNETNFRVSSMYNHRVSTFNVTVTVSRPSLESRVGVGQELREVRLEPGAGLGGGLEGVGLPAVEVVPGGGLVAGAVRLAAGLDPDEGILNVEARVGGGAQPETSSPGRLC